MRNHRQNLKVNLTRDRIMQPVGDTYNNTRFLIAKKDSQNMSGAQTSEDITNCYWSSQ